MVAIVVHVDGTRHGLEQTLLINTCNEKACFVQGLGALGAGADADGREWVANRGEE